MKQPDSKIQDAFQVRCSCLADRIQFWTVETLFIESDNIRATRKIACCGALLWRLYVPD